MNSRKFIPLLPFASSLLMWLSYHPVNLSFLAWVAYAPLFVYLFIKAGQDDFFCSRFPFICPAGFRYLLTIYLAGLLFFMLGLWWLHLVTWAGVLLIPIILACYWVLFALGAYFIIRTFSPAIGALSLVCFWVFLEYLRSFVLTGFPWFFAGHTQYQWLSFIQICDITGVYGISFIVVLASAIIAVLVKNRLRFSLGSILLISFTLIIFAASIIYGQMRIGFIKPQNGPRIGIVQGNIPQSLKIDPDPESVNKIYDKHLDLTLNLLKEHHDVDLIVWAETMLPYLVMLDSNYDEGMEAMKSVVDMCQKRMLIGALTCVKSEGTEYKFVSRAEGTEVYEIQLLNSAYYFDEQGEILDRYDKIHLVPVSEYVPLRRTFPFIDSIILNFSELPYIAELSSGTNLEPFVLPISADGRTVNYKYGVQVCYEGIFPELARDSVKRGADFIINISNDGWFQDSAELEQILVMSAFRAVENKVGFVRATNTGISAIISPIGKIKMLGNEKGEIKEVENASVEPVIVAGEPAMSADRSGTFYGKHGDKFPWLCLILIVLFFTINFIKNLTIKNV